jgi:hypothetical protein
MHMPADPRAEYDSVVAEVTSTSPSVSSKMFGMPCLKNDLGKAYAGYYGGAMVFKLGGSAHSKALALPGASLFDPSGRGRPMKEWVVVPAEHSGAWLDLARDALAYSAAGA